MSADRAQFGRRLQAFREARGLSQRELGRRVGAHWVTIAKWEGGAQEPSASRLIALSVALRVSPNMLMGQPRRATEEAIEAYRASSYYQTLEEEGRPLTEAETEALRYLIDSRWMTGAPSPKVLHGLVRVIRENPEFFAVPGPKSGGG